jgi:hypothetical protein
LTFWSRAPPVSGFASHEIHETQGKDQFVGERRAFADAITGGCTQVNTLSDAREDLEISAEIIGALKRTVTR